MRFRFPFKDAVIHEVDNFEKASDLIQIDAFTFLNQDQYVLNVPGLADFKVENGRDIYIKSTIDTDDQGIKLYLYASVLAAYLYQNKTLSLHASAFDFNKGAMLLCGDSGAGKSSLTYYLHRSKGFPVLADDLSVIDTVKQVELIPFSDRMKLWGDTLQQLALDESYHQIRSNIDKYFVPIAQATEKVPIKAIFMLQTGTGAPHIKPIHGGEAFQHLFNQVFRQEYLEAMPSTKIKLFTDLERIAKQVPIYLFQRSEQANLKENAEFLLDFISAKEPL